MHASTTSDVSPKKDLAYPEADNNARDEADLKCHDSQNEQVTQSRLAHVKDTTSNVMSRSGMLCIAQCQDPHDRGAGRE